MTTLQVVLNRAIEERGWTMREFQRQTEAAAEEAKIQKSGVAFSVINYAINHEGATPNLVNISLMALALNRHPTAPKVTPRRLIEAAGVPLDVTEPGQHLEGRIKAVLRALENDLSFVEEIASLPLEERQEVKRYIAFRRREREKVKR